MPVTAHTLTGPKNAPVPPAAASPTHRPYSSHSPRVAALAAQATAAELVAFRAGHRHRVVAEAFLRNLAITILRLTGAASIAAALRHHARQPSRPLQAIMKC
jgi:hypothetical protein